MHYDNKVCRVKSFNADSIEQTIVDDIYALSQNEAYLNRAINELNRDLSKSVKPLLDEEKALEERLSELNQEISRYVDAIGRGNLSVEALEKAMADRQSDGALIQAQLENVRMKINSANIKEFDASLVRRNLLNFRSAFDGLDDKEKAEALQCILKDITIYPDKIVLNIFDLPEFNPGSQKRTTKLRRLDSNQRPAD